MTVNKLLAHWRADASIIENIVEWRELPARAARTRPFPPELHPGLTAALQRLGIDSLYTHQEAAWQQARQGRHVAVVAGTASGKTLCYNLPILDSLLRDPEGRALYLFPTKALAQDQLAGLQRLIQALAPAEAGGQADPPAAGQPHLPAVAVGPADAATTGYLHLPAAIYDGDTPARNRRAIRSTARLLLTNPDMLHLGILPHHTEWAAFFGHLRYIVLDEAHIYRGVFGSHVANVLRRVRRVAQFYGGRPTFLLTTATLANPAEFAARLIEEPVSVVDEDGAPRGPRHFMIYNPPLVDRDLGLRRSAVQESVRLAQDLLAYNVQTILFGRSRRTVEVLLTYLRERAQPAAPTRLPGPGSAPAADAGMDPSNAIRGYRSGYLPAQRREIERGLRSGAVRAVAATNALELGIDIGGMGASILVGYPGTVAATWQQAGRAGRGTLAAISMLVSTADPLDQFLAAHPDYFFARSPEHALINPDNLLLLLDHLRCAAFELPFNHGDGFGHLPPEQVAEFLDFLVAQGILHHSGSRYFWIAEAYPSQMVSLRSVSADPIVLQTEDEAGQPHTIGVVDRASALWLVHPQAVYLHEAQAYFVEHLDLEQNLASLRPSASDYYTMPRSQTTIQRVEPEPGLADEAALAPGQVLPVPGQAPLAPGEAVAHTIRRAGAAHAWGELLVTRQVVGFQKVRWHTHEVLGIEPLELPPTELLTTGYWLALEPEAVDRLRQAGLWRNDPNDYGPGWPALRERVRLRDGYRCQVCGAPEQGRQHDVHHKIPFRLFLSPAQANQLDNLITLCHACHQQAETAVRVRSGLAGLGYVLGHLAPFFLMCDPGDLGVHSDPQAAFAGGSPAVAIYDQAPGGIGLSQRLFELHADLLRRARQLVGACPCSDGCPSCIGPGGLGVSAALPGETTYGGKQETIAILDVLTDP